MNSSNGNHLTVAFDTWPLMLRHSNTGIHVYARNLLSHFRKIASRDSVDVRPLVCGTMPSVANEFDASNGFNPHQTRLLGLGRVWRYGGACLSAFACKADVLFCPSPTTLPMAGLFPVVATIHDIMPILFPDLPKARSLKVEFATTARFSRALITDSNHSKQDLVRVFNVPPSKVHVVYLACDETTFNNDPPDPALADRLLMRLGITRPYILHHGRIQERKNIKRLIEAYSRIASRRSGFEFDLLLVGELGWRHKEIVAAAQSVTSPARVIFAGALRDPELAILLKQATLVVIPSLYEGFCLPLLEAMTCGAPTVCSSSSCLPEISGGVLRYFDPYSVDEMATCIEQTLESTELRAELSLRGKQRASFFSWQRCAEETMEVLKSAARS